MNKFQSAVPMVLMLLLFVGVHGQVRRESPDESYCPGPGVSPKRCVDVAISYDGAGEISSLSVSINKQLVDAFTSPGIPRENVMEIIDEYFPPYSRGKQLSYSEPSLGRAYGEHTVFEKLSLTLTITCREKNRCGVSYAVATLRKK